MFIVLLLLTICYFWSPVDAALSVTHSPNITPCILFYTLAHFEVVDNSIRTTKYTILTFLPINLFEQFRRVANFYFLCIAMIQLAPGLTNIDPSASIAPLIFVLAVTAIKEAYEDWVLNNDPMTIVAEVAVRQ